MTPCDIKKGDYKEIARRQAEIVVACERIRLHLEAKHPSPPIYKRIWDCAECGKPVFYRSGVLSCDCGEIDRPLTTICLRLHFESVKD